MASNPNAYWYYTHGYTWARIGAAEKLTTPIDHAQDQAALSLGVHDGKAGAGPRSKAEVEAEARRLAGG